LRSNDEWIPYARIMDESEDRLSAIFAEALEIADAKEREAYLARACGADTDLRQQVEELLRADAHAQAGQFLPDQPVSDIGKSLPLGSASRTASLGSEKPGDRIGRYKLLEKIGEGGCGLVYMAEQEEPLRRKVALKVIKLGMDTRSVVARFETERQALALMDHPNIAKVLDAGSTELGRPYFVMELVKGIPITRYCDENKLNMVKRLGLFVQVCQAVQHAHQKGIIHRDIKPSNILVADHDGLPVPKIIDFGIAKATTDVRLTDKTLFTALEQFIGTPAYMSPEQAKLSGLDIDTRSDIYSLGVLLYELLTGNTPFDAKRLLQAGLDGIRRIIREEDPPRPSARLSTLDGAEQTVVARRRGSEPPKLLGTIRGDLDWIVMKCLEKDRTRRYETANGLAADLQRHLNNEPVIARPPDAAYRFKKALGRHRLLFLGCGAVAAALVLGISVSSWQAIRARRAEARQSVLLKAEEQARHEAERQRRQAVESEERALSLLYASDLQAVGQAIDGGRLERARSLLKRHLPGPGRRDRRGFEWFYYSHVTEGQQTAVLLEQTEPFERLIVSPNGKTVVLQDNLEIKTFDLARREVTGRWPLPGRRVGVSAISADGRQIALRATNGVGLLNTTTGQFTLLSTGFLHVVSFAADRPWIAMCFPFPRGDTDPPAVQIWDYEQHRQVQSLPNAGGPVLWWETNSTVLACLNHEGFLERWDAATGAQIQKVGVAGDRQELLISGAVSTQGGKGVVFASPGVLRVFDPADGRVLSQSPWPVHRYVALSADGQMVVSIDNARIRLANTGNLQEYERLAGHLEDVTGVGFIGATSNLVSCGEDGRLLLWEPREKFLIPFTGSTNEDEMLSAISSHVALSADQRYCSVYAKLWSLPSGAPVRSFAGSFLGFSPNGTEYAIATSNTLEVWKCADRSTAPVSVFPLPTSATNSFGMSLSADGRFGTYATWDNHNFNVLVFAAQSGHVLANAADQAPVGSPKEFPRGEFLPASDRMAVFFDPGIAIWDWQAGTNGAWVPLPGDLFSGASPDGHWIAVRDASGRRLTLMVEGTSPRTQIELEGHNDSIVSAAFSHDGLTLASVDVRSEVRLWKLPEGQPMGVIPTSIKGPDNLAFSTDDQRLYLAGNSGVQVLEAPKPAQIPGPASSPKSSVAVLSSDSVWTQ
jgi:WD40 repeat protein